MGLDSLDETKPLDTDPVSFGDDEIRKTRAATKESFGLEHWLSGEHKYIVGAAAARPSAGKVGRLFINSSNNTIEYDNGSAWIATGATLVSGSVGPNELANGAVSTVKLADNSVTSAKIVDGTITAADIANGTITSAKLAPGAIDGSYIANGSIDGAAKIKSLSITAAQIADNSIPGTKIQDNSITIADIFPGSTLGGWGGTSKTTTYRFTQINQEIIYLEYTYTSRGGNALCVGVLHCVVGIPITGGAPGLVSNMRLDGTAGGVDGTLLTYQDVNNMAGGSSVIIAPATLITASKVTVGAGTHRIKISAYVQNQIAGYVEICSGFSFLAEWA